MDVKHALYDEGSKEVGRKDDAGKLRWDLIPLDIMNHIEYLNQNFSYDGFNALSKLIENEDWCLLASILLPYVEGGVSEVVGVYTKGATKYGDNNWQLVNNAEDRYKAALCRHCLDVEPSEINPDFGYTHAAHAIWNCIALEWFERKKRRGK